MLIWIGKWRGFSRRELSLNVSSFENLLLDKFAGEPASQRTWDFLAKRSFSGICQLRAQHLPQPHNQWRLSLPSGRWQPFHYTACMGWSGTIERRAIMSHLGSESLEPAPFSFIWKALMRRDQHATHSTTERPYRENGRHLRNKTHRHR